MSAHFVVLGLARPRTAWFADLGRWATSGVLPIEFIRCLTAEEVRLRLRSGRAYSALLVDVACPGFDRDLLEAVTDAGAATIGVADPSGRAVTSLPLGASLRHDFEREDLLDALAECAPDLGDLRSRFAGGLAPRPPGGEATIEGQLVAVTGPGGTGASVLAIGLAQALGAGGVNQKVLLADFALHGDQAMLHSAPDIIPGLSDVVDVHRHRVLGPDEIREHTFEVVGRGYDLLLGLRRHRDWAALRPRAVDAALASVLGTYGTVVVDIDADLEGERECGAVEVEERNMLARAACARADVVLVVGRADLKGVHALARTISGLLAFGTDSARVLPVVNFAPRHPRRRAEIAAALASLVGGDGADTVAGPIHVGEQRRVESALRDGTRLPAALGDPLASAIAALRAQLPRPVPLGTAEPEPIRPGSLGHFATDRAAS